MNIKFEDLKEKIIEELNKRVPDPKCPLCGHGKLILIDGFFTHPLQSDLSTFNIGGTSIPTVGVYCEKCGNITYYSLGILGLLPKKEGKNEK